MAQQQVLEIEPQSAGGIEGEAGDKFVWATDGVAQWEPLVVEASGASGEWDQCCGVRVGHDDEKTSVAEAAQSQLGLLGHGSAGDRVRQEAVAERGIDVGGAGQPDSAATAPPASRPPTRPQGDARDARGGGDLQDELLLSGQKASTVWAY
ncbi:hypothetical protein ACWDMR_29565 [Streptomyces althioticus]|uniref:hypothetical protein n=1 Tax=Streptomyces althioticus TaxID=83380 RepID=UPI00379B4EC1